MCAFVLVFLLGALFLAAGCGTVGMVITVSPGESIQAALDRAGPGDIVRVAKGMYVEQVRFTSGGTPEAPIVLEGEGGAVIYGDHSTWNPQWRRGEGFAKGVYATPCPFFPAYVEAEGHYVEGFNPNLGDPKEIFARGGPKTGWDAIRGTWCFIPADKDDPNSPGTLLFYWDAKDPRTFESFRIAPVDSACVTIDGADYCVVRGLDLRASEHGVLIKNSRGSVVEYCTVGPTTNGIRLRENAHACKVLRCEVHCNPCVWDWTTPGGTPEWSDLYWLCKRIGFYNRRSISLLESGDDSEIAYNYIHHCYQGVEDKEDPDQPPRGLHKNLHVHHNVVADVHVYGYAPNSSAINQRWHNNLATRTGTSGMRVKRCKIGPLFIYRNVFTECRTNTTWVYSEPGERFAATTFIYNNTFSKLTGGVYVVYVHNNALQGGMPYVYMRHNLYYFPDEPLGCYKHNRIGEYEWDPEHFDCNVIPQKSQELLDSNRGDLQAWNRNGRTYPHQQRPFDEDFMPTADSPAIDVPGRWDEFAEYLRTVDGVKLPPDGKFPGLDKYTGTCPDAGAREYDPTGKLGEDNVIGVDPATVGAYAKRPQ